MNLSIFFFLFNFLIHRELAIAQDNYADCGKIGNVQGDIRSSAPWTAGIFIRQENANPKFFTTATIIGPTTVLAIAPGPFGAVIRGSNASEGLPSPDIFTVVAGLGSTDYNDADSYSQASQVIYIEPDLTQRESNDLYHYVVYHLKTIFDFKTPYVKAICLHPISSSTFAPIGWEFVSTGFGIKSLKTKSASLSVAKIQTETTKMCASYFRFHYKKELESDIYCGEKSAVGNRTMISTALGSLGSRFSTQGFCFLHGSITMFQFNERWHLAGMVALIPDRKRGKCDDRSVYIFADVNNNRTLSWLANSVSCSPDKFACEDPAKTCVPVTSVCNGYEDCPGGKDEHPVFCEVQNPCNKGGETGLHSCGVTGNCILETQICDGKFDCLDGSDERFEFCVKLAAKFVLSKEQKSCPKLTLPKGVQVECGGGENCLENVSSNSTIKYSCQQFYTSPYAYSTVEMTCDGFRGFWKNKLPFSCNEECGIDPPSAKSKKFIPFENRNLPWNGFIVTTFFEGVNETSSICSAVLIDRSFVVTSIACLRSAFSAQDQLKVVLAPATTTINDWIFIEDQLPASTFWTPKFAGTQDYGLTLIKLETPAKTVNGQGNPICYLNFPKARKNGDNNSNSTALVVHITKVEPNEKLEKSYFSILPKEECELKFGAKNVPYYKFCGRLSKGPPLTSVDRGAGLYTREKSSISGDFQFRLKGIVTDPEFPVAEPNSTLGYQLFTNTDFLQDFILQVMEKNYDSKVSKSL